VSTALGLAVDPSIRRSVDPPTHRSEPHELRWEAVETRERFAREHPEVLITPRRDGGRLRFDVSEPNALTVGYGNAVSMLADLARRYPA
jgi:hypothetical protein